MPVYLEEDQLDLVYSYLSELYMTADASATCQTKRLKNTEQVPFFVLDVLFPEARLSLVFAFILHSNHRLLVPRF